MMLKTTITSEFFVQNQNYLLNKIQTLLIVFKVDFCAINPVKFIVLQNKPINYGIPTYQSHVIKYITNDSVKISTFVCLICNFPWIAYRINERILFCLAKTHKYYQKNGYNLQKRIRNPIIRTTIQTEDKNKLHFGKYGLFNTKSHSPHTTMPHFLNLRGKQVQYFL